VLMTGTTPYWCRLPVGDLWQHQLQRYQVWAVFHRAPSLLGWQAEAPLGVKSQAVLPQPRVLWRHEPRVAQSVLAWVL
jgi:hypothetical protein